MARVIPHIASLTGCRPFWPERTSTPVSTSPGLIIGLVAGLLLLSAPTDALSQPTLEVSRERARGLLVGSLIGDAAGAPTEFAPPVRYARVRPEAPLSKAELTELAARFVIHPSDREQEPFGPWSRIPATLTDDSRFKIIFFDHLAGVAEGSAEGEAGAAAGSAEGAAVGATDATVGAAAEATPHPSRAGFAAEILDWEDRSELSRAWLAEFAASARWVLGDSAGGLPPERAWGGIPTMAGQMPFLPVALLSATPEEAYRATWDLNFLDNGFAKDITSAIAAGLREALNSGATWQSIEQVMRSTDPYGFGRVPWVPRQLEQWLDAAAEIAREAHGSPERLYELLDARADATTWWEGWVPVLVTFSAVRVGQGDPLATMQIIQEFGHDTDSYLQLAGAFLGALHGADVFPEAMRSQVTESLARDYGASVDEWLELAGY
ncbi:MAG: ADP-ribosylglycohydrolase family protein [Rhodothermales bacterium]|nr:ADP-ribosylglycohydrolase family protein [Rhodothermales bacterium]